MSDDGLVVDFHGSLAVTTSARRPVCTFQLELQTRRRGAEAEISSKRLAVASPDAFALLGWPQLGGSQVFAGQLLYVRAFEGAPWTVRVTYEASGVVDIPVHSMLLLEAPTGDLITSVAVQGSGTIEYLVAGTSIDGGPQPPPPPPPPPV